MSGGLCLFNLSVRGADRTLFCFLGLFKSFGSSKYIIQFPDLLDRASIQYNFQEGFLSIS